MHILSKQGYDQEAKVEKRGLLIILLNICLIMVFVALTFTAAYTQPAPTKKEQEKVSITIYSASFGSAAYLICLALADTLNKYHPWIRATAMEALGGMAGMKEVITSPPEKRKLCLSFSTDINVPQAQKGEAYFKGFQYDMRLLSNAYAIFQPMLSINPKIRTKDDVIGKRVSSSGPKGSTRSAIVEYSLNAWGIMDKVKYQYIDIPETKDAMVDGFIDVSGAAAYIKPAVPYRLDPKLEELVATKTVYLIHLSREDWAAYQPKAEYKFDWGMVPKNAIRPGMPEEEKGSIRLTNGWFAPIDMDPKITYEIAKFISQRHKDIEKQFPVAACTYREMQATGIWTEDLIHPGALKWYKEAGIKIGR